MVQYIPTISLFVDDVLASLVASQFVIFYLAESPSYLTFVYFITNVCLVYLLHV